MSADSFQASIEVPGFLFETDSARMNRIQTFPISGSRVQIKRLGSAVTNPANLHLKYGLNKHKLWEQSAFVCTMGILL
jgi:hypothetical protein